jgi:hypothetical protein
VLDTRSIGVWCIIAGFGCRVGFGRPEIEKMGVLKENVINDGWLKPTLRKGYNLFFESPRATPNPIKVTAESLLKFFRILSCLSQGFTLFENHT